MHNRHFVISMTIEGEKVPAYSAVTLNLPPQQADETDYIIKHSRELYASSKAYVERFVGERYLLDTSKPTMTTAAPVARPVTQPAPEAIKVSQVQPSRKA